MAGNVLNIIKSRGYWRINFRPLVIEDKFKLPQCKDVVEKNSVNFRWLGLSSHSADVRAKILTWYQEIITMKVGMIGVFIKKFGECTRVDNSLTIRPHKRTG